MPLYCLERSKDSGGYVEENNMDNKMTIINWRRQETMAMPKCDW
jgi:hypothetical protein